MTVRTEPATCSGGSPKQAASNNQLRSKSYRKPKPLSSLKLQIGELLLFGNKECRELWSLFEVLLRQYWGAS